MIQLDLYLNQINNFLRTVTIKNPYFADSIKTNTLINRNIEYLDDYDNPYYINLNGEYALEDTIMYVLSIDTGETVRFDKDLKDTHPKTYSLYKLPNSKYHSLCSIYNNQTDLIKSIVYPIHTGIDVVTAEDFSVLGYDDTVLQTNERESMIECLHSIVDQFKIRWNVKEYIVEEYYPTVAWSCLWYTLYINLLAQRMKNLRTRKVHTYHIWEYLQSKGLKDYRSLLNNDQQIFLYKNIDYLLKNKGKTSNLRILSEELLYPYGVSLNTKSILLNTENSIDDCSATPIVISEDLYTETTATQNYKSNGYETIDTLVSRMYNDDLEIDESVANITKTKLLLSKADKTYTPTKLVELKKIIINTRFMNLFYKLLVQSLVYGYTQNKIRYYVSMIFPLSTTYKTLEMGEAIALLNYCVHKENGVTLTNIPTSIFVDNAFKTEIPDIPKTFTSGTSTYNLSNFLDVDAMLTSIDFMSSPVFSSSEYITQMDNQFTAIKTNILELGISGDMLFHRAMKTFYRHVFVNSYVDVDLVPGYTTYADWFASNTELETIITLHDASVDPISAYNTLGTKLTKNMIPVSESINVGLSGLNTEQYAKMKSLFMQLCSYNIAFLDTDRNTISYMQTIPVTLNNYPVSSKSIDEYNCLSLNNMVLKESSITTNMNMVLADSSNRDGSFTTRYPISDLPYDITKNHITSNHTSILHGIVSNRDYTSSNSENDINISNKY